MNERDFAGGDASSEQLRTNIVVDIESFRIGRGKVAKDELSRTLILSRVPNLDDAGDGKINLGLLVRHGAGIDEPHVERSFSTFARDLQHVVHRRVNALLFQPFSSFRQSSDERFQFRTCGRCCNRGSSVFQRRPREVEHICRLDVGHGTEYGKQFGKVDEFGEARVHPVSRSIRGKFERCHCLSEVRSPRIKVLHFTFGKHLWSKIPKHRVHLREGVGDRCACGEHNATALAAFLEIADLQEHVECAVAVGIRQARNPAHFCGIGQVLVQVGLVHKELIDAQFFERHGLVFRLAVRTFLEPDHKPFLGFLQFLHDAAAVVLGVLSQADFGIKFRHLLLDEAVEIRVRHGQVLE